MTLTLSPDDLQRAREARRLLIVLMLGVAVTTLDLYLVNISLPQISDGVDASFPQLQLILVAYTGSHAVLLLLGARLGDAYGRRRCYFAGISIFLAASLLCATAHSPTFLVTMRAAQGAGAALLVPQIAASIRAEFDGCARQKAFGLLSATQAAAITLSPVICVGLGYLNAITTPWRLTFLVNLPIGLICLYLASALPSDIVRQRRGSLDLVGVLLSTTSLLFMLVAIIEGRSSRWPGAMMCVLLLSAGALAMFVMHERALLASGRAPLVDVSIFQNTRFSLAAVGILSFYFAVSSFFFIFILLLRKEMGFTQAEASFFFLPGALSFLFCALLAARFTQRGNMHMLSAGPALFCIGLIWIAILAATGNTTLSVFVVPLALIGAAQGITVPTASNLALSGVVRMHAGAGAGVIASMQVIGTTIGIAVVGALFSAVKDMLLAYGATSHGRFFGVAFAIASLFNVVSMTLSAIFFSFARKSAPAAG